MDPIPVRMLLVYDGSSVADRALEVAIVRAKSDDATVTLLGVVAPRLWRAKRGQFQVSPEKHDEEFAREQLDRAKKRCREAGIRVETRVRVGPPAHVIAEEVAAHAFRVVILAERRSLSGAPALSSVIVVPDGTEVVAVA
jgi:nucleotide-binding universal stress UspA family protein